jgi:hypothetical protein
MAALFSDQPVLKTAPVMLLPVRALAVVTAVTCWAALAFQFVLILQATYAAAAGGTLRFPAAAAVVVLLSFLTLQLNLLMAMMTTCAAAGIQRFERVGRFRSAIAAYMLAGSLVFILALQPYWHHRGAQLIADILTHYVTPALYIAFWLSAVPKSRLRWRDPVIWLVYPALYLLALLLVATWTEFYPYPFMDVRVLGFGGLVFNLAALSVTFLAIGLATVAVARTIEPAQAPN